MLKVALTGGIATGKSYVLARLRDRGVATIDSDEIVHEQLGPGTRIARAIAVQFGSAIANEDGSINRKLLAGKVFRDTDARLRLEAIVHPVVYEEIRKWFATLDRPVGVASIPLLLETHREGDFDVVIVTACSEEQQLQRLIERGLSEEDAKARIGAQMPTEGKVSRADFVISTAGTLMETDKQVEQLLVELGK